MHGEAYDFVRRCRPEVAGDVLDIGGRNINGSARDLFHDAESYIVTDLIEADGVDLVGDICEQDLEDFADTVLCLEVLEHAEDWAGIVAACERACRPGGTVIITCAGPGRAPHSASDGGECAPGEWYRNVSIDELFDVMSDLGLEVFTDQLGPDSRACGRKRR